MPEASRGRGAGVCCCAVNSAESTGIDHDSFKVGGRAFWLCVAGGSATCDSAGKTCRRTQSLRDRSGSVLADDVLGFAGLPHRDVEVSVVHLDRRRPDQIGAIAVFELLAADVEAGLFVQRLGEPPM
mgnify:CR=1 FL=1